MKKILLAAASALALMAGGAMAETIIRDGCEWKKAENGNYFTRVNPGCKIGHNGNASPKAFLEPEEPGEDDEAPGNGGGGEDPGTDPEEPGEGGEEPGGGDDEGEEPGTGGEADGNDEGGDKPTKPGHGHGDDNHDHSGPPGKDKPGKDKPGKGGKGGKN